MRGGSWNNNENNLGRSGRHRYVLQCDIRKYFPSIDHEILKAMLHRRIADAGTQGLIDRIIDSSNDQEFVCDYFAGDDLLTPVSRRRGLPIGNLTSQFFANVYLNPLDHFVKESLGCRAYVRYVDDFALFSDSKPRLRGWQTDLSSFLDSCRLKLHPRRVQISPSHVANRFLGQVVCRSHRRLVGENVRRFRKRLHSWERRPPVNLCARVASWIGHARQADTRALLESLRNPLLENLGLRGL